MSYGGADRFDAYGRPYVSYGRFGGTQPSSASGTLNKSENAFAKQTPPLYESYASSEPFTFFVGPNKERYTLPSALIDKQSPKLDALVHNGIKESTEKAVTWSETRPEVFFLFGDFVHTGNYNANDTELRMDSGFLIHAQVYVFADYHGISALKNLGLQRVRLALIPFTCESQKDSESFIELAKYSFENTVEGHDAQDALRSLIIEHTVRWCHCLLDLEEFQDLITLTPELSMRLIKKISTTRPST